jgi:hypothetical protein
MNSITININSYPNLLNKSNGSKSNFYPNSAYRSAMAEGKVTRKATTGIVYKYMNAIIAYETFETDEIRLYLEAIKKEYRDFLALKHDAYRYILSGCVVKILSGGY